MKFTIQLFALLSLLTAFAQAAPVCTQGSCQQVQARDVIESGFTEELYVRTKKAGKASPPPSPKVKPSKPKPPPVKPKPVALKAPAPKRAASPPRSPSPKAPAKRVPPPVKPKPAALKAPAVAAKRAPSPPRSPTAKAPAKGPAPAVKPKPAALKAAGASTKRPMSPPKSPAGKAVKAKAPAVKPKPAALKAPIVKPLTAQKLSERLVGAQRGKAQRQENADRTKKRINAETLKKANIKDIKKVPAADPKASKRDQEKRNKIIAENKANQKKKDQAITAARAAAKTERAKSKPWTPANKIAQANQQIASKQAELAKSAAKIDAAVKAGKMKADAATKAKASAKDAHDKEAEKLRAAATARKAPKPPKMTRPEKAQVKDAFKQAAAAMRKTDNLPNRKDTFTVGKNTWSGKDVRQGIFNSKLHANWKIGHSGNRNPKTFNNEPYSAKHPDPKLRGKTAIPKVDYKNGMEYPIKSGSKTGWIGVGEVGAGRVITYDRWGKSKYAVVGHDLSKGGDPTDHYLAKQQKAKRELYDEEFE